MNTRLSSATTISSTFTWSRVLRGLFFGALLTLTTGSALAQIAVSTLAGVANQTGSTDTAGGTPKFNNPQGIVVDSSGNIFVADANNHTIRKITAGGVVTTLAGSAGSPGGGTSADGTGSGARFNFPEGLAIDSTGTNLYVADTFNNAIRKIVISTGVVSTVTGLTGGGTTVSGFADGAAGTARFSSPVGITVDSTGTLLYVADIGNNAIRQVTISTGAVVTVAGGNSFAGTSGAVDGTGGSAGTARFNLPRGIAADATNIYVADQGNHAIRVITISTTAVTTLAGTLGTSGSTNANGTSATFKLPGAVAVKSTKVYVADSGNNLIRQIDMSSSNAVTTLAGSGSASSADGIGTAASFSGPLGIAVDSSTNLYIADTNNYTIRKGGPTAAPAFTQHPTPSAPSIAAGANVTFNVTASGNPTASYQWQIQPATSHDGFSTGSFQNITNTGAYSGATSAALTITSATLVMSGDVFRCIASNGVGSNATSNTATLTVTQAPHITSASSTSFSVGAAGTFTVTATGSPAPTFSITSGSNPASVGVTLSSGGTLSGTPSSTTGSPFTFVITATNSSGTDTQSFTLTIQNGASITTPPSNQTVALGANATFTVVAGGTPNTFTYQWYRATASDPTNFQSLGAGDSIYTNTQTASLTVVSTTLAMSGDYFRCVVNNGVGSPATSTAAQLTVTTAPQITSLSSATFAVGQAGTFQVQATGSPTPTFSITSGTSPASVGVTLGSNGLLSGTPTSTTGSPFSFVITASNVAGNSTQGFTLTILPAGSVPAFTTQPADQTTSIGQTAAFTVVATGTPTPTYQWQRQPAGTTGYSNISDNTNYSGTTTATLTISNATTGMSGDRFQCVATNTGGSTTSNSALLTVNVGTIVTTLAGQAGVIGSTDATGTAARFNSPGAVAVDSSGNLYIADTVNCVIRKITSSGVVTTIAGLAGTAGSADGAPTAARFNGPLGIALDGANNIYVADTFNHTIRVISAASGAVSTLAGTAGSFGSTDDTGVAARFAYPQGVTVGQGGVIYVADSFNHTIRSITSAGVVTTLAGVAGSRGSADGTTNTSTPGTARFANPTSLGVDSAGNIYVADSYNHTIRKISLFGSVTTLAGTAGSIGSVDGTGAAARFNQASGLAVDAAGNVYVADTFNNTIRKVTNAGVVTTLAGLAGSTGSTDGTGSAARFNQPYGIAIDLSGNLYIADTHNDTIRRSGTTSAPTITTQPVSRAVGAGSSTTFTVAASGAPTNFTYQWQINPATSHDGYTSGSFQNLTNTGSYSGVTSATLTVTGITVGMSGDQFQCIVSNFVSPDATTNVVTLTTVVTAPTFTSASSTTFTSGQSNSFTVTASGSPAATFSATGLPSWATLDATSGVLSGTPPDASGSPFSLVITANNGATATQNFTLAVVLPVTTPVITSQPGSVALNRGQTATFTVSASGTAPLSYQWNKNGVPISGATDATLTLTNVQTSNIASYTVTITNSAGTTTSGAALLSVNSAPVISTQPHSQTALVGSTVIFSVTATGSPAVSYQWQLNGADLAGATSNTLTLTNVQAANAGNYAVIVSNSLGSVKSSLVQFTVTTGTVSPVILASPVSTTVVAGGTVSLSVVATGVPAVSYQWRKNGVPIVGATAANYVFGPALSGDAGNYDVVVTNTAGSIGSQVAAVHVIARSYAGVYFGTFGGSLGNFAFYVRPDNTGVFLGYFPSLTSGAISNTGFTVSDVGSFSFISSAGSIAGTIANSGAISGSTTGVIGTSLTGSRSSDIGNAQALAGYYQAGVTNGSGSAFAIVNAAGQIFVLTQTSSISDGGIGVTDTNGRATIVTSRQSLVATVAPDTSTLTVVATAGTQITTFAGASEAIIAAQRLANISTRARVDTGASIAVAGFVISGTESKPVLIRAIGPTLANFGISSSLAAPKLALFSGGTQIATNTGWTTGGNTAAIVAASVQAGAFALPSNSADSVLLVTLPPGNYTAQVSAASGAAGVALIEVYDLSAAAAGQKLFNISTRANAGSGDATLIAGISVNGTAPKRVLVRAVGPGLVQFGLTGVLGQPKLQIIKDGTVVAQNIGVNTSPDAAAISLASVQVGAFTLPPGSSDSALLVNLAPGNYSAVVTGADGGSGIAIVEVYEVP